MSEQQSRNHEHKKPGVTGFIKGFFIGFSVTVAVLGGSVLAKRLFDTHSSRSPAAIDKAAIFDVSYLEGGALKSASARQLLQSAEIVAQKEELGVSLGHFVTKNETGEKKFLCDVYDHVSLRFEAEGIAISGERPSLEVMGPCQVSENLNKMRPLYIPIAEIKAQPPADGELSFGQHKDQVYRVSNVSGQWPTTWVLTEVRVSRKDAPGQTLFLDRRDVYNFSSKPIMMSW